MAHDNEGESIATTLDLTQVIPLIKFMPEGYKQEPYMEFKAWQ